MYQTSSIVFARLHKPATILSSCMDLEWLAITAGTKWRDFDWVTNNHNIVQTEQTGDKWTGADGVIATILTITWKMMIRRSGDDIRPECPNGVWDDVKLR